MSVVAKILVVLNLVLAIVFLGMASTFLGQQESWKVRHDAKVKEMGDEIAKWKQNYDSVNTNYQLQLQETARLQTENSHPGEGRGVSGGRGEAQPAPRLDEQAR